MAFARPSKSRSALALTAVSVFAALAASAPTAADAQDGATAASGCSGVTLTPASRSVRPGGRVLLSGQACGASYSSGPAAQVQLQLKRKRKWATIGSAAADTSGSFSLCAKVNATKGSKVARLRATGPGGASGATALRLTAKGSSGCESGAPAEEPAEVGNPNCPLSQPGSTVGFTLPVDCTVVASDTSSDPDPLPFWGSLDCANSSRHQRVESGGDSRAMAVGGSQGDSSYRRMTVFDGDDFWGERCELGANDRSGPVAFYREGRRRVTYASFRLPSNFPTDTDKWQGVLQMKQGQSSDNGGGTPVLSLGAFQGKWSLWHSAPGYTDEDFQLWEVPAQNGVWTRFAIDVFYSQYASKGRVKVYVDLNADSDFSDAGEQSPAFQTNTLKHETGTDTSDGLAAGQSIPSHLRVGMYHHPGIPCPTSTAGCSVESDNIQIVKP